MDELTLIVKYKCKAGGREPFLRELTAQGILKEILAEEGCIEYKYAFSADDADELILIERWANAAAQQQHIAKPHMQRLRAIKDSFVLATNVSAFRSI